MWDFFETVRHRRSVRKYRSDMAVEQEKLHAVLEMACAAPSAGDLQSYHIAVVTTPALRAALAAATDNQPFLAEAPAVLVFCANPARAAAKYGERGRSLYALQDTTIAATYAQLACVAAGLGSAWVGHFDEAAVRAALKLDADLMPIVLLTVGYAAELPEPTPRRHLDDLVSFR